MPSADRATDGAARTGRRTPRLDAGRVAAAVPLVLLLAAGLAHASGQDAPAATGPGLEVPTDPVRLPSGASGRALDGGLGFERVAGGAGPVVPAPGSPGAQPVSSGQVRLDRSGIPTRALEAYERAERLLAAGDPGCRLDRSLVAAIGRVESAHGTFGGNRLGADGVARPGIVGVALDGSRGTARITDTDDGRWDGDLRFDRAVGPMQFIPGTWTLVGVDADGDGVREPQDVDDAAAATGVYLCSGPGDLSTAADRYSAVFRYNRSDDYVRTVLAIADAYARGVELVGSSSLPGAGGPAPARGSGTLVPADPAPAGSSPTGSPTTTAPTTSAPTTVRTTSAPPAATAAPGSRAPRPSTSPSGVVEEVVGAVTPVLPSLPLPAPPPPATPEPTPAPAPSTTAPALVPGVTCQLAPVLGPLLPGLPLCPEPTP